MKPSIDSDMFFQKFSIVCEMYGKKASEHLFSIYWELLEPYEWEDVSRAFSIHMTDPSCGQYFPKPADIVRLIEGTGETKALLAWTKVEGAMSRIGVYPSVAFDDLIIHAVISDMGGWHSLCLADLDEITFKGNEFRKRYSGYINKPPQKYPKYFIGLTEAQNSQSGFPFSPPVLVGDKEKAEKLLISSEPEEFSLSQGFFFR